MTRLEKNRPDDLDSVAESRFDVTVVMTLMYPRGRALQSIASWTSGQSLPREKIQIVVVSNGRRPELEASVEKQLRSSDLLLRIDSDNEMELYDSGARRSAGRWIVVTEPHVLAEPTCLENLIHYAEVENLAGACVKTIPMEDKNWIARMESRMYLQGAESWTADGDWRKFTKRGVLLRRSAFQAIGGFKHRYLRFAEMVAAATLRDQGLRLGFAQNAEIKHFNSTELGELLEYVAEYSRQACLYQRDHPGVITDAQRLFDEQQASRIDVPVLRNQWKCLRHAWFVTLRRPVKKSCPVRNRLLRRTLVRHGIRMSLELVLGRRTPMLRAWFHYMVARCRLLAARFRGDDDRLYEAFMEVWHRAGQRSMQRLNFDLSTIADSDAAAEVRQGNLTWERVPTSAAVGFHTVEMLNGRAFRWTSPVATLRVNLAVEDTIMTFDTGSIAVDLNDVRVYLNGQPCAAVESTAGHDRFGFRLSRENFDDATAQLITILSPQLKGCGASEHRALGMPLFAVHFASQRAVGVGRPHFSVAATAN